MEIRLHVVVWDGGTEEEKNNSNAINIKTQFIMSGGDSCYRVIESWVGEKMWIELNGWNAVNAKRSNRSFNPRWLISLNPKFVIMTHTNSDAHIRCSSIKSNSIGQSHKRKTPRWALEQANAHHPRMLCGAPRLWQALNSSLPSREYLFIDI